MNRTIRNDCRELLLKLLGVNLNRLSEQTRAEVRHVTGIGNNGNTEDGEEMIEQPTNAHAHVNISSNQNQIVPLQSI